MPRKKPNKVSERTAIIGVSDRRRAQERTRRAREPRGDRGSQGVGLVRDARYGMTVWGGTIEIVSLHTTESIRQGATIGGVTPGSEIVVEPVVTSAGTCVFSPFAKTSSAARVQFPFVIVHQFFVIG